MKHNSFSSLALIGLSALLLTGCNLTKLIGGGTANVSGSVMGGLNPIAGSNITVYEATNTTPSVLGSGVSDAQGHFSFTYNVPLLGGYVYIVANGGVTNGVSNPHINLVNILGEVPRLTPSVTLNELTTVGAYQALTNNWNKTASIPTLINNTNNIAGLQIGLNNYANLVNSTTGYFTNNFPLDTSNVNSTGYQLAAQANVLAVCVQQAADCSILANGAYLNTAQDDTFSLMTGLKTTNSTQRSAITSSFLQPNLATLPYAAYTLNQSALMIVYNSGFNSPQGIAADIEGNIWIENTQSNNVTEIVAGRTPGAIMPVFSGGFNAPKAISIDPRGNIWVANTSTSSTNTDVLEIPAGSIPGVSTPVFSGFNNPSGMSADTQANLWVANTGSNNVIEIPAGSAPQTTLPAFNSGFNSPSAISTDTQGNAWITNPQANNVVKIPAGSTPPQTNLPTYANGLSAPSAISTDIQGNLWIASSANSNVEEIPAGSGTSVTPQTFSLPNSSNSVGITTDIQGNIWIISMNGDIVEIPAGSTPNSSNLKTLTGLSNLAGVTTDAQGNIWVTTGGSSSSVTEILN